MSLITVLLSQKPSVWNAEFQKLWRSVPVDSMDEEKIEEYLKKQGISSMQETGPKKVVGVFCSPSLLYFHSNFSNLNKPSLMYFTRNKGFNILNTEWLQLYWVNQAS